MVRRHLSRRVGSRQSVLVAGQGLHAFHQRPQAIRLHRLREVGQLAFGELRVEPREVLDGFQRLLHITPLLLLGHDAEHRLPVALRDLGVVDAADVGRHVGNHLPDALESAAMVSAR